jgi:hypothetical protein
MDPTVTTLTAGPLPVFAWSPDTKGHFEKDTEKIIADSKKSGHGTDSYEKMCEKFSIDVPEYYKFGFGVTKA